MGHFFSANFLFLSYAQVYVKLVLISLVRFEILTFEGKILLEVKEMSGKKFKKKQKKNKRKTLDIGTIGNVIVTFSSLVSLEISEKKTKKYLTEAKLQQIVIAGSRKNLTWCKSREKNFRVQKHRKCTYVHKVSKTFCRNTLLAKTFYKSRYFFSAEAAPKMSTWHTRI